MSLTFWQSLLQRVLHLVSHNNNESDAAAIASRVVVTSSSCQYNHHMLHHHRRQNLAALVEWVYENVIENDLGKHSSTTMREFSILMELIFVFVMEKHKLYDGTNGQTNELVNAYARIKNATSFGNFTSFQQIYRLYWYLETTKSFDAFFRFPTGKFVNYVANDL